MFALLEWFRDVQMASGTVFKFYAPGLIFDGTEGVRDRFHVLRSRTLCGWYRGRQVSFSYFALLVYLSAVSRAPGPVFMFCAPGLFLGSTEAVGARFHVLRSRNHFGCYRG
jgi:hypothetical protein